MKPLTIHDDAELEIEEAIQYYEGQRDGLGDELHDEIERILELIQQHPQLGMPHKSSKFRYMIVRRFPYVIYYLDRTSRISIVAVSHGSRRPDYWIDRKVD